MYGCIRRATNHERRPDHRHYPLGLGCRRRIDRAPPQPGSADKFAARRRPGLHQYRAARCARVIGSGFIAAVIPQEIITGWLGPDSGWLGVLIAATAGA